MEARGLRAITAILGTAAGLDGKQRRELDRVGVKMLPVRYLRLIHQVVKRQREQGFDGGDITIHGENQVKTWAHARGCLPGCQPLARYAVYLKEPGKNTGCDGRWCGARRALNWQCFPPYNNARYLRRRPS